VERKKRQRYRNEFRRNAVERMNAWDNIFALAQGLGVDRRLLYVWRDRPAETHGIVPRDKTVQQIGCELGVSYVLEGSVRRVGRRVRVTAQLIQVADQTHVWVES
jgi:transposase-like protein